MPGVCLFLEEGWEHVRHNSSVDFVPIGTVDVLEWKWRRLWWSTSDETVSSYKATYTTINLIQALLLRRSTEMGDKKNTDMVRGESPHAGPNGGFAQFSLLHRSIIDGTHHTITENILPSMDRHIKVYPSNSSQICGFPFDDDGQYGCV